MNSHTKKVLSILLTVMMLFTVVIPAISAADVKAGGTVLETTPIDPSTLNVPKLGEVDEDDAIKSEKLPYGLDDTVRVSIFLTEPSARDAGYAMQGVSANKGAVDYQAALRRNQASMQAKIEAATGKTLDVKWNLTLLTNAISANVRYGDLDAIRAIPGVKSVEIERRYEAPITSPEADAPQMTNARDMVRSSFGNATNYNGAGQILAIIDTGLDVDHQSVNADAFDHAIDEDRANGKTVDLLTQAEVSSIKSQLSARNGVYKSTKLPFIYNYVDENTNVGHEQDTASEHGSHVAGIAAANRYIKSGSSYVDAASSVGVVGEAPDAQILVMKVFGAGGGASDSDYMVAVEDAVRLGATSANLSLGSRNPGIATETASTYLNILNSLEESELVLSISMGNNTSWDTQKQLYADDVNLMTGGSPGSFNNSFAVASIDDSGAAAPLVHFGDVDVKYDMAGSSVSTFTSIAGNYQFVYIDGPGYTASGDTYSSANDQFNTIKAVVNGKIALCNRGTSNFSLKADSAFKAGAVGVLIVNNTSGSLSSMSVEGYSYTGPVAGVRQSVGDMIRADYAATTASGITYYTGPIKIDGANELTPISYYEMSDFSSWGVPGSLTLKPEITAPGGSVYSLNGYHRNESGSGYSGGHDQYELMSGTSMAAPQITGLSAALGQYFKDEDIASKTGLSRRHFVLSTLMSTATPVMEEESGYYYSLLKQGAGLANLEAAVDAKSYIKMDDAACLTADDYKVKAELGDDPARSGEYTYAFEIHNFSDTDVEYTLRTDVFTQALSADKTLMEHITAPLDATVTYVWDNAAPIDFSADVDKDGDTDEADADAILKYVSGEADGSAYDLTVADLDDVAGISSRDAYVLLSKLGTSEAGEENQIVPAHGMRTITVTIKLTTAQKAILDAERKGGAYLEAFTFIESDDDVTYSIPVLGFYGSWTDASMFDAVRYEESVYGTDQSSYFGATNTNGWQIRYNGASTTSWYLGNPYVQEDAFPADKLALSNDALLYQVRYNLIRPTAGAGLAVVDEDGRVLYSGAVTTNENAAYFNTQATTPAWQNTSTSSQNFNRTVGSFGAADNKKITFGYFAFPEYYTYQANGSDQTFALTSAQFKNILSTGNYGKGAYIGYTVTVDNEAPEIGAPVLNSDGTVTIHLSDNQYIANLRVMDASGSTTYVSIVPDQSAAGEDVTYTFTPETNFVTIFAGDYAGNEAAVTTSLDGSPIVVEKTIYKLTNTITAGKEYLIVNTNTAGTGYALGHSGTTLAVDAATIKAADSISNTAYIESSDVDSTSVWTFSAASNFTIKNGNYYLRRNSNTGTTLQVSTSNTYNTWTWNGTSNYLTMTISNRTYYVRYNSNAFSLYRNSAQSVYIYEKTEVTQTIDPTKVTSVEVNPTSLDLYRGESASLGAKVLPLTASDRTVSWSSSNPSIATVDENGVVTAVAAGNATITATANGDTSKKATCAVTVTLVSKNLNGIIWDEEGGEFFSSFNTSTIPTWTKSHTTAKSMNLNSAFMSDSSTLYAATLDAGNNASTLYTVNRTNYNTTEYGNNFVLIFDLARASTRYTGYFVYAFASYLVFGNLAPEDDEDYGYVSGLPYGLLDAAETDVGDIYIAAVAARSIGTTSSSFYFLDESGKIWQTTMSISSSVSFGNPTLVVDTGIATDFLYQNLYYDGTYLYWGHTADNYAELIIINPTTKAVYHAGNFGEGVWPATGFYVNGSAAPAAVEDETAAEAPALEKLAISRDELMTDAVKARIAASAAKYSFNKAASDEPVNEVVGGLNAVSKTALKGGDAVINAATAGETDSNNRVTVSLSEAEATNNGKIIVTYDADTLTYLDGSAGTVNNGLHFSVNAASGTITVAYASLDAIAADAEILNLTFEVKSCADTKVTAVTNELNDNLALDAMTEPAITGLGHDWGDWTQTTAATCVAGGEEKRTCSRCGATETRETGFDANNHSFTDYIYNDDATCTEGGTKTAVCDYGCGTTDTVADADHPATGHAYEFVGFTWVGDDENGYTAATANFVCANDASHMESADAVITTASSDASCTAPGTVTYTAKATFEGQEYSDAKVVTGQALGHDYVAVVTDATCTEGGYTTYTCSRCGDSYTGDETNPLGHDYAAVVTDATCTDGGYTTYTCSRCGDNYVADETNPLGHDWGEWTETKAATCSAKGEEKRECSRCDATETRETGFDASNHSFTNYIYNDNATCTEGGTKTAVCDYGCGTTDTVADAEHPATGHAYEFTGFTWVGDDENGYTAATANFVCANDASHVESADAVITTASSDASCTAPGTVTYTAKATFEGQEYSDAKVVTGQALGHDYVAVVTAPTCTEGGYTTYTCSRCGDSYTGDETHALGHDYVAVVTDATCTEGGYTTYTCSRCGDSYTGDETNPLGHDYAAVVTDATCTDGGYTTYTCSRCGDNYVADETNPLGHDWGEWTETKAATCSAKGEEKRECSRCDATETRETGFDASNHSFINYIYNNDATCTEGGTKTAVCDYGCGTTDTVADADHPATGHAYGFTGFTWVGDDENGYTAATANFVCANDASHVESADAVISTASSDASCTAPGTVTYTAKATFEGQEYSDAKTVTGQALGHDYVAVVTDPTCTEGGYTTYTCSRCGDSYTGDETDALGHDYVAVVTDPTCTEGGYTTYICSRCGDSYTGDETDALGHDYAADVTDPTCTEGGYTTYTCSRCGDSYTGDETDALGHDYAVTYVWSDDNATVTATAVCSRDASHTVTETASSSVVSETPATSASEGKIVYVVSFDSDVFEDQTKTVTLPKLDPAYEFVGFEWNDDNTAVVIVKDNNNGGAESRIPVTVTSVETAPSCTEAGSVVYTATYELGGTTFTDSKSVSLAAIGHKWKAPRWIWNADNTAKATFVCENDASHVETVAASVRVSENAPTCTAAGATVYTAAVTFNGKTYTDLLVDPIPATGHDYDENGVCRVCGDGGDCPWCGSHHNRRTLSGWWTELVHHILYILNRIFLWWSVVAK